VGPRPVIPSLVHEFRRAYERLVKVRPGITDPRSIGAIDTNREAKKVSVGRSLPL
jgi:lipopolysaccharide/colanic/teichoic acid biosynthesis glycosyltransferase